MERSTQERIALVVDVLEDSATLVGEFQSTSVTLRTGATIVPGLGQMTDSIALKRRAQDIRKGVFTIVVIGTFKNGKSTLINALLGKEVVRARAIPTTAVITMLVSGTRTDVALYERQRTEPQWIDWRSFVTQYSLTKDDVDSERGDRFNHIDYAHIETQHPFLTQGIKLVDSPGLGEDDARTATTRRFVRQAQAVLFVLDANKLLAEAERVFIREHLGEERLEHVFFVVNRINEIDSDEVSTLVARLKVALGRHFANEYGGLDEEFFRQRVFFVDAKGALEARSGSTSDAAALGRSGVPQLKQAIYKVLTSDGRFRAVVASSTQAMDGVITDARYQIARRKMALAQPLGDLLQRHQLAQSRMRDLQALRANIHQSIQAAGEQLFAKASADFTLLIDSLEQHWATNAATAMPLAGISLADLAQCAYSEDAKRRVVQIVQDDVAAYVRSQFTAWSDRLGLLLAPDTIATEQRIQQDVSAFLRSLNAVQDTFATGNTVVSLDTAVAPFDFTNLAQVVIDGDAGDLNSIIQGSLRQLYIVIAVWIVSIFSPVLLAGAVLAALTGRAIANPFRVTENFKTKLRAQVGSEIHTKLRSDADLRTMLYTSLAQHAAQLADQVSNDLSARLTDVSRQMQHVIDDVQSQNFSIAQETQRLDQIGQQLTDLFELLSAVASERTLTVAE